MLSSKLKWWRSAGIITIIIAGFLMHYAYSFTNSNKIVALLAPVNESVWEHLKLGYWSLILFSIAEYFKIKQHINNYFTAKLAGIFALEITIVLIFYGYISITGMDIFWIDISSYIVAAITGQYITYKIYRLRPFGKIYSTLSVIIFVTIGVLFGALTYFPPHYPIFKDQRSNTYGIYKEK